MISRLARRLLRLSNTQTLTRFSTYDDEDGRGKSGKSAFFSKKGKSKEAGDRYPKEQQSQNKETQHKTIKFLKKHELKMKNLEPQPSKQLRFKKKTTPQNAQTQKPAPFVKPERGQTQEQQIQKSIFFSVSSPSRETVQKRTPQILSLPQLNSYLNSPSPSNTFYERLSQDLDDILSLFENKKWKELNYIVQGYSDLVSPDIIQKQLHSLLINHNARNYVVWLKESNKSYDKLSKSTLIQIYNYFIKENNTKQLTILLEYLIKLFKEQNPQKPPFKLQYSSIQIFLTDIHKDSPLNGLQQRVNQKIDVILLILDAQFAYCSYQQKKKSKKEIVQSLLSSKDPKKEILDQWFDKLATLALDRIVSQSKFKILFEEVFTKHFPSLNLSHIYQTGLFLRLIETFYFGSYINIPKIQSLFRDFIYNDSFQDYLTTFKDSLVQYKAKTGKFAFPNAKNLVSQFQLSFQKTQLQKVLFYFVLVVNSNQKKNLNDFMKKRKFLVDYCQQKSIYKQKMISILSDGLFSLSQEDLKSVPVVKAQGKKRKQNKKAKEYNKTKEAEVQGLLLFPQLFETWSIKQSFPDSLDEQSNTPQQLGWRSQSYLSYYNQLSKQMEKEVNPYRKELLNNILKAKLNAREQDFKKFSYLPDNDDDVKQKDIEQKQKQIQKNESSYFNQLQEKQNDEDQDMQTQQQIYQDVLNKTSQQSYKKDLLRLIANTTTQQLDQNELHKQKIEYENKLAIKSAIKLKKYELAYALCDKIIMQPLIYERTAQNIFLVVKLFLLEENRKKPIQDLDQLLENISQSIQHLSPQYVRSVYERYQNFDQLISEYTPPNKMKFQFWQATLAFNNAQDILKLDISNRIKSIKYEAEYQSPPIPKDSFIKKFHYNWRQKLMAELGITKPEIRGFQQSEVIQTKNEEQYFKQFIEEGMFSLDNISLRRNKQRKVNHNQLTYSDIQNNQLKELQAKEEAQAAKIAEAAQQQTLEAAQGEAVQQAVQQAEGVQAQSGQSIEDQPVTQEGESNVESSGEQLKVSTQQIQKSLQQIVAQQKRENEYIRAHEQQEEKIQKQIEENQNKIVKSILGYYSSINDSDSLRIKGYDFASFLKIAKTKIKPIFQQEYEQQKQFKKHMINLESLAEQSRLQNVHYLQQKIYQYQKNVRSLSNIHIFMTFGLWNYNFDIYCLNPERAISRIRNFRKIFYKFKTYEGKKGFSIVNFRNKKQQIIFNNERVNFSHAARQLSIDYQFNQALIDNLLMRRIRFFKQAQAVIKTEPSKQVEELILWGLQHDEPMGIYLGEKIAMLTNQIISHPVAQKVADYLSHRKEIPSERIQRCKQCLKVVGRINRENIYDFNHDYAHITVRKHFNDYLTKRGNQLGSSALEFISRVDPISINKDKKHLKNNLRNIDLVA